SFVVRLFDVKTGKETTGFKPARLAPREPDSPLAFSPDGRLLATARRGGDLVLLDAATGAEVRLLPTAFPSVTPVFSPDGRSLAVATLIPGKAPTLSLWEVATGKKRWQFDRLPAPVTALTFSPDGRLLATGHSDTTTLVWDVTGRLVARGAAPPRSDKER